MNTLERFDALSARWLHMAKRNNLTPDTLRDYESFIRVFRDYLTRRTEQFSNDTGYVDFDDIQGWIDDMAERGNKPSTIKQRLVNATQFFGFATKPYIPAELRYEQYPVSPDFYPKTPTENIPEALTDEQIIGLWEYKKKYRATDAQFARNYALVALILTTGLRNKEVLDLKLSSIDLRTGEIFVQNGKGRKTRIVDMDNGPDGLCAAALENYLLHGDRPENLSDEDFLFGTTASHEKGKISAAVGAEQFHRGTTAWLSQLVERHVKNQVGQDGVRSHDLRHCFARTCLNSTGNLAELQGALGHASPVLTERYSGRLLQKRARESARAVIVARDAAAEQLRQKNTQEQTVIKLYA